MTKKKTLTAIAICLAALGGMAGCGSDSPAPAPTEAVAGKVIQGPVSGATVFADYNGNGVLDSGEPSTTSSATGAYSFTAAQTGYRIATIGGTDTITQKPANNLVAPRGAKNTTTLTTLVAYDTTNTVTNKLAGLAGVPVTNFAYDSDFSTGTSPALLNLAKTVDLMVQSVTSTIRAAANNAGATISSAQLLSVQQEAFDAIADTLADNTVTATTLSTPANLLATMQVAVTAAFSDIKSRNSNITLPATQVSTIAQTVTNAATTAVLGVPATSTTPASTTTNVVENQVITPEKVTVIEAAITATATTVAAQTTVTSTPSNYVPPVIVPVPAPTPTPTGSTGTGN